jgi:hypothetical protein
MRERLRKELTEELKDELKDELNEQLKKQLKKSVLKALKKVMEKKKRSEPLPSEDSDTYLSDIQALYSMSDLNFYLSRVNLDLGCSYLY